MPALPRLVSARGASLTQGLLHIHWLFQDALAETIKNPRRRKENHSFKDAKIAGEFREVIFPVKQCLLPGKLPLLKCSYRPATTKLLLKLNALVMEPLLLPTLTSLFPGEST